MSKLSTFSSRTPQPAFVTGAILGLCLLLTGCPLGSNPTKSPTSTSSSESPGGAGGLPGGSSGGGATPGTSPVAGGSAGSQTTGGVAGGTGDSPEGSIHGADGGAGAEPGFGDAVSTAEGVPDLRDTPTRNAESAATGGVGAGQASGSAGTQAGEGDDATSGTVAAGASKGQQDGPLTPEERVAVLDAELARGTGEFDALILKTQEAQRQAAQAEASQASADSSTPGRGANGGDSPYDDGLADAGGYSTGGGMGGTAGGGAMPENSAKYPPPKDIPSGNDDDVVARQLREAAMREPDPAVRERLWEEYRKYKGLTP